MMSWGYSHFLRAPRVQGIVEGPHLSMLDHQWQGAVVETKICYLHGVVGDGQVSDLWQELEIDG